MKFGRFKGVALCDVNSDYLMWLYGLENLERPLRDYVRLELEARGLLEVTAVPGGSQLTVEIIEQTRRQLALKYHPTAITASRA
jgi:hypothetical protein